MHRAGILPAATWLGCRPVSRGSEAESLSAEGLHARGRSAGRGLPGSSGVMALRGRGRLERLPDNLRFDNRRQVNCLDHAGQLRLWSGHEGSRVFRIPEAFGSNASSGAPTVVPAPLSLFQAGLFHIGELISSEPLIMRIHLSSNPRARAPGG